MHDENHEYELLAEQYAALKRRLSIVTAVIGVSAIAIIAASPTFTDRGTGQIWGLPAELVLIGFATVAGLLLGPLWFLWWRCPACGKHLGDVWFSTFCRRCGVRLKP